MSVTFRTTMPYHIYVHSR